MVESKESGADGPDTLTGQRGDQQWRVQPEADVHPGEHLIIVWHYRRRCPDTVRSTYLHTMCTAMPPPVLTAPDRVACEAEALAKLPRYLGKHPSSIWPSYLPG